MTTACVGRPGYAARRQQGDTVGGLASSNEHVAPAAWGVRKGARRGEGGVGAQRGEAGTRCRQHPAGKGERAPLGRSELRSGDGSTVVDGPSATVNSGDEGCRGQATEPAMPSDAPSPSAVARRGGGNGGLPVGEHPGGGASQRLLTRALVLFAGRRRPGSMGDALRRAGWVVDEVDIQIGGAGHDLGDGMVQSAIRRAVRGGCYQLVWLGTPCSSFSVLHLGVGKPRLRSRSEPEGCTPIPRRWRAYLEKHNRFVDFSATVAEEAWRAGATYVVENPVDRGWRRSPHYSWRFRDHVPLWIMPRMRELVRGRRVEWVSIPQCAFRGKFQKWTTLLAAGPRAAWLNAMRGLGCEHEEHDERAQGAGAGGRSRAAEAAEYPALFAATVAGLLTWEASALDAGALRRLLASEAASRLQHAVKRASGVDEGGSQDSQGAAREADGHGRGKRVRWRASGESMPEEWDERADMQSERVREARGAALRYVSRRRAEPEEAEVLARREMPKRRDHPALERKGLPGRVLWPSEAPRRPIAIHQLFHKGVYEEVRGKIDEVAQSVRTAIEGSGGAVAPWVKSAVFKASDVQPAWARECVWDTTDPEDCVPLQPFSREDPPEQQARPEFFLEWAERLDWKDKDMIQQVVATGVDSGSECSKDTVIFGHHQGLRENVAPAKAVVDADTEAGWVSRGRAHPWTVPVRAVPRNVVRQTKWKLAHGELMQVTKWRVTTDDSMAVGEDDVSRNAGIHDCDLGNVDLPVLRDLGEAVAIVRAVSARLGMTFPARGVERVALWALDLSSAYRMLAVARTERWLQQFVWADGVRREDRCVFGTKSLVDLFERVSTFVLAVAKHRIAEYDEGHPYDVYRRKWMAAREAAGLSSVCTFADIYIDDGFGITCVGPDEDIGQEDSRPRMHLAIVRRTFQEAGWEIATEKVQLGWELDLLGLAISSRGDGRMFVPEAKRRGMVRDVESQLEAAAKGESVEREEVERLVGRASHLAQVVAEGNAFLKPLYRLERATFRVTRRLYRGGELVERRRTRVKPRRISVGGRSAAAREFRVALEWWRATLMGGVSVPLAPRLVFPQVGEAGCLFVFTDAAREDGTGFGGFTIVIEEPSSQPTFMYVEQRWSSESLRRLQRDEWSMPAGEMFGAAMIMSAVTRRLSGVSHIVCFSDSVSTVNAVTTGSSAAPQLNTTIRRLQSRLPQIQMLGIHQPGVRNGVSDKLSRGKLAEVLVSIEASAVRAERLTLIDEWEAWLRESQAQPTRTQEGG